MDTQWPQELSLELDRRAARRIAAGPQLIPQAGARRRETEAFIADAFARAHGARIAHFMPVLLAMRGAQDGRVAAACGLRAASGAALFLEHYLDGAVEQAMHAATGVRTLRSAIAEIGNLAVAPPASARQLIAALTRFLAPTPFEWVVFTALPSLRNAFARLGVPVAQLGEARPDRLPPALRADWGSYYDAGPRVCAVSVDASHAALRNLKQPNA
jgi:hypothetical protein